MGTRVKLSLVVAGATVVAASTLAVGGGGGWRHAITEQEPGRRVFADDFEGPDLSRWEFSDPSAWRLASAEGGGKVLALFRASRYEPPVRSPLSLALVRDLDVADFVLEVKLRSTARDYGHRDLCLFFGYQGPDRFYYVHLGKEADEHAHSIFLVDGKPRVGIAEARTQGTPWTDGWHRVRVVRDVDRGRIQVFFDDFEQPIMTAHDQTFLHGRVGLGSFDDTGMFDELRVTGVPWAAPAKSPSGRAHPGSMLGGQTR